MTQWQLCIHVSIAYSVTLYLYIVVEIHIAVTGEYIKSNVKEKKMWFTVWPEFSSLWIVQLDLKGQIICMYLSKIKLRHWFTRLYGVLQSVRHRGSKNSDISRLQKFRHSWKFIAFWENWPFWMSKITFLKKVYKI